jgi:hypothetical protein
MLAGHGMYTYAVLVRQSVWQHGCSAVTVVRGGLLLPTHEHGTVTDVTSMQSATVHGVGDGGGQGDWVV